jgi:hypothetical protein
VLALMRSDVVLRHFFFLDWILEGDPVLDKLLETQRVRLQQLQAQQAEAIQDNHRQQTWEKCKPYLGMAALIVVVAIIRINMDQQPTKRKTPSYLEPLTIPTPETVMGRTYVGEADAKTVESIRHQQATVSSQPTTK